MSARDDILAAVQKGLTQGQGGAVQRRNPDAIRAEAAQLLANLDEIRPDLAAGDPVDAFVAKCANPALGVTLDRVANWQALPRAVIAYLDQHDLPHRLSVSGDPRLDALTGIEAHQPCAPDEAAAISVADWGVAETGSVVIHSAPDQPILNAMLPRHWLVVVEEKKILPFLDDYATYAASRPRNAVLITGSSGTTDIEGFFVRGAHGPGFVHVLLVAG
ncbi:lactate utilization protein [Paracoccus aurantiacus]|uniref:Lactate utilization protein n=1 Tax=Paracoccus aurantiacus TaxID=2599412 RepID=A0A5C6SAZ2_9RHOB|nr:LUD domain-containing protein [Paracoccus aurantiacus]TXB70953.1 lactate utilization protein [Paracoccus aurantiacus]